MTVKFDNGKALDVNGTLVAQGTSSNKITFTSSATSPAAGDWKFIRFNSSSTSATFDGSGNYLSGSILQYCTVEYAGAGSIPSQGIHVPAINSLYVSPFVDHCTIQHNGSHGLYVWQPPAGVTIRITNNIFDDNLYRSMYVRTKSSRSSQLTQSLSRTTRLPTQGSEKVFTSIVYRPSMERPYLSPTTLSQAQAMVQAFSLR